MGGRAVTPNKPHGRGRLIAEIRRQKAKIAQLIQDVESWNENNPWGELVDVGLDELFAENAELDRMLQSLQHGSETQTELERTE